MSEAAAPKRTLWVCAAVLIEDGKVMLTQRPAGSNHAGAWEFPGGKIEPGETPRDALVRELQEELALPVVVGDVLEVASVPRAHEQLTLLFFRVSRDPGNEPEAREVAAIAWFSLDAIPLDKLTPADRLMGRRLGAFA